MHRFDLEHAISVAAVAHKGQKDGQNMPYILHPLRVMEAVRQNGGDETLMIAAVLHDVVEDTAVTALDIYEMYGVEVGGLVVHLTRRPEISSGPGLTIPEETYPEFIRRVITGGHNAMLIKVCDIKDNLGRLDGIADRAKRTRLKAKYEDALYVISKVGEG